MYTKTHNAREAHSPIRSNKNKEKNRQYVAMKKRLSFYQPIILLLCCIPLDTFLPVSFATIRMSDAKPPPDARVLSDSPTDGITGLQYLSGNNNNKSLLASCSWDGSVYVHNTTTKSRQFSHQMESGPLLSLTTLGDSLVTGGMDGSIRMVNLEAAATTTTAAPRMVGRQHHATATTKNRPCRQPLALVSSRSKCHPMTLLLQT